MKKLKDVLAVLGIDSTEDIEISDIYENSSEVTPGSCFVAIKGENTSGGFYLAEAKSRGAVRILSDTPLAETICVPDLAKKLEELARYFYDYSPDLALYGVTGTTGKSTVAYLLASMLEQSGKKTFLLTTTPGLLNSALTELTTPRPLALYRQLDQAKSAGYEAVVMECSSIGIALGRIDQLFFRAILITNITSDHLDFHGSVKRYRATKLDYAKSHTGDIYVLNSFPYLRQKSGGEAVVHRLRSKVKKVIFSTQQTEFTFDGQRFQTPLLLKCNIENLLLVYGALKNLGIDKKLLATVISKIAPLPGRIERVCPQEEIFIDYAHTAAALKCLLRGFKRAFKRQLIVVVGAGGGRDRSKRRNYRHLLRRYADVVILTDDNPRYEDSMRIIEETLGKEEFIVIPSRRYAIKSAIKIYQSNFDSILLIVGKGPEEFQLVKGEKIPFSDREEVKRCLKG